MENKGTEKKSFEFKRRHIVYIIIGTVVVSVVGALIINFLYSVGRNGSSYHTEWQASDTLLFFATVLEALGTISLGAISIWQNVQLQKSNEESQGRLEKINIQANEITIIEKIADYEEKRLRRLELACEKYKLFCTNFLSVEGIKLFDMDVESRKKILKEYQIQSENMYNDIFRELSWQTVDDLNLKMKVTELNTVVNKVLGLHLKEIPPTKEALDALTKSWSFSDFYSKYIKDYRSKLEKILFTKMTLQDIRELYNRPEGEQSNGQAENAE